jgi:hypothetical protein
MASMATRKNSARGGRKSDDGRLRHSGTRRTRASQPAEAPKLPKTARRVHDAVELASGRIETKSTARAPSAATRLRRLARFGFRIDLSLFGPSYRLTAQTPYQVAPEAWLDAFDGSYSAGPLVNRIWWRLPATFPTTFIAGVNLNFRGLRAGPAVFSLKFEAWPYRGRTGTVVIMIGAQVTEIPISAPAEHTIDVGFIHDGSDHMDARVLFRQGLLDFVFREASVGVGPFIVLDPSLTITQTR